MKFLKKILNATEIVAKEYTVLYYNEDSKSVNVKGSLKPQITITVSDALDTDIIVLTATKNETVQGDITWSCNLASDVAEINGATLTFKQHYEGSVTLTATAVNASAEKTITVTCGEVATAYTYSVNNISSPSVTWDTTSVTINFIGKTIAHYDMKADVEVASQETKTVTFTQNPPQGEGTPMQFTANTEFVDLGLPSGLLWAKCNLGAQSETEAGAYFSWGDTVGYAQPTDKGGSSVAKDITDKFLWNDVEVNYTVKQGGASGSGFSWATEKWNGGNSSYNTTYFASVSGTVCPNKSLASIYDAAHVNMGGDWRMPTSAETTELINNTIYEWQTSSNTEFNGVAGMKFTSKSDSNKFIFIPAVGYCRDNKLFDKGSYGHCWTKSIESGGYPRCLAAKHLQILSTHISGQDLGDRCNGYSIRAVMPKA